MDWIVGVTLTLLCTMMLKRFVEVYPFIFKIMLGLGRCLERRFGVHTPFALDAIWAAWSIFLSTLSILFLFFFLLDFHLHGPIRAYCMHWRCFFFDGLGGRSSFTSSLSLMSC